MNAKQIVDTMLAKKGGARPSEVFTGLTSPRYSG